MRRRITIRSRCDATFLLKLKILPSSKVVGSRAHARRFITLTLFRDSKIKNFHIYTIYRQYIYRQIFGTDKKCCRSVVTYRICLDIDELDCALLARSKYHKLRE